MIRMTAEYGKLHFINALKKGTTVVICLSSRMYETEHFQHPALWSLYEELQLKRNREKLVAEVFNLIHSCEPGEYRNVVVYRNHTRIENKYMELLGAELEEAGFLVTLAYREK